MIKTILFSLCISLLPHCGTEVGNHYKEPEDNRADKQTNNDPEAIKTDPLLMTLYAEQAFFLDCGSPFDDLIKSPISLNSNNDHTFTGSYTPDVWELILDNERTYLLSKTADNSSIVLKDDKGNEIDNQFTCGNDVNLSGMGTTELMTRYITVKDSNQELYKAEWTVDETSTPPRLIKLELQRISDNKVVIEWE